MKKIIFGILFLAGTAVYAQSPHVQSNNTDRSKKHEQFKKDLNLDEQQEAAIKALREEYKTKAGEIKNNSSLNEEQRKSEFMKLHKEKRSRMQEILTPEQTQMLKEKKAEYQKNKKGKGEKGGYKTDYAQLKKDLNLTDQQVNDMKALNENYRTKKAAVKSSSSLDEEAKRAQYKSLRSEKNTELKKILSEEQYNKYKEMRSQKGHTGKKSCK
ncbi:MAG: hypothetical protein ACK4ND_08305 [Cytophagaceae bacterium]